MEDNNQSSNLPEHNQNNNAEIKSRPTLQKKKSAVLTRYPSHLFKFRRDTDQITQGPNEWIHACLPYDILLVIFTLLPRKDLRSASIVCKLWRSVSRDPLFGWVPVKTFKLNGSFNNMKPDQLTLHPKPVTHSYYSNCEIKTASGQHVSYASFINDTGIGWKLWRDEVLPERIEQLEAMVDTVKANPELLRSYLKQGNVNGTIQYVVELHIHTFEQKVRKGEDIGDVTSLVCEKVQDEQLQYLKGKITPFIGNKDVSLPQKSNIPTRQPPGLKKGISLYKYQLDVVRWMKSVEEDIAAKIPFKYAPLVPWRAARTEILFDLNKTKCIPIEKIQEYIQCFYPKGGVLADEMGLGKTMEVLGLILANPATDDEIDEEPSADAEEMEKLRFNSKATIVICPNHLIQQWHDEMVKHTDPPLKVLAFDSVPQLKAAGYENITQAGYLLVSNFSHSTDVVIVSLQLLKYAGYIKIGITKKKGGSEGSKKGKMSAGSRTGRVLTQLKKARKSMDAGEPTDAPMLEHFRWHRFVIDEAHEVMGDDECQDIFSNFNSKYYWYVSGTPIPNEFMFADILWNNLYWRNTKESVKDEYQVPNVVEDLVLLDFTDIEKALYADLPETGKRELCSKMPILGSCKTLNDIRDFKIEEKTRLVKQIKTTIFGLKQDIEEAKEALKKKNEEISKINSNDPNNRWHLNYRISERQSLENKISTDLPKKITLEENNLANQEALLRGYEATKSSQDRLSKANRFVRGLTTSLHSSSKSVENNNNNNNAQTAQEEEQVPQEEDDEEDDFPTEQETAKMKATELKEFISKYGITPKSSKSEMLQQMKYLRNYSKSEEGKKAKREQKAAEKKRKQAPKETASEKKAKKQKTEQADDAMAIDTSNLDKKAQSTLELAKLVETLGTKMANMISYLKNLWEKSPESRVIIFSQFDSVLDEVGKVLEPHGIKFVFVKGKAAQKIEALNAFQDTDSSVRVILLSLAKAASGSNLIQASHVVLLGTKEEVQAVEAQAIGRAYRQGQTEQVTVVRFLIKETIEYSLYINYLQQQDNKPNPLQAVDKKITQELALSSSSRPNMLRSSSVTTILANAPPSAQNGEAVVELLEKIEPVANNLLMEEPAKEEGKSTEPPQQQNDNEPNSEL